MTATDFMKSILLSSDKSRLALLASLILPLLETKGAKDQHVTHQIWFPVTRVNGQSALVYETVFDVADWTLLSRMTSADLANELRAGPGAFVDETGDDHDALIVMLDERTVLVAFAADKQTLKVKIGGFQSSGVIHDGGLAKLSADVAASSPAAVAPSDRRDRRVKSENAKRAQVGKKRRTNVKARLQQSIVDKAATIPLPAFVIRLIGLVGKIGGDFVQPILYRDSPPRLDENGLAKPGPAQIETLAARVKTGLGVHVLQTSHALRNLGFTKKGADDKIEQELAGGELGVSLLMGIGRTNLSDWTGLDSESQLALFASKKYRILESLSFATPMPDRESRARAELANIKPLSLTYVRAKNVLGAFERARKSSQKLANVEISATYAGIGANFSTRNLIEIAMTADVNPIPLWPSHGEVSAGTFEVLRFIGRLQRGTNAILLPVHFDIVRQALVKEPTERTLSEMVIAGILNGFYDARAFTEGLNLVEQSGDALVIARSTRDLAIGTAVPQATLDS